MKIVNGLVYGENYKFSQKDVCIKGEFFADTSGDGAEIDAGGNYVIPVQTCSSYHVF